MPCTRCRGSSIIHRAALLEHELAEAREVDHSDREHVVCPTCEAYGPFGLVPLIVAIEGSLIGAKELTRAQKQGQDWLDWIMR